MKEMAESKIHTIEASAQRWGGVSPWTLRKHIREGNIAVVRLGRRVFISEEEVQRIQKNGLPSLSLKVRRPNDHT